MALTLYARTPTASEVQAHCAICGVRIALRCRSALCRVQLTMTANEPERLCNELRGNTLLSGTTVRFHEFIESDSAIRDTIKMQYDKYVKMKN